MKKPFGTVWEILLEVQKPGQAIFMLALPFVLVWDLVCLPLDLLRLLRK